MQTFTPPAFKKAAYHCPHCNAYSQQLWLDIVMKRPDARYIAFSNLLRADCTHCKEYSLWHKTKLIYPESAGVPSPNNDLNDDIKEDYREAMGIINKSPRGAAALLRLCIQKLCCQLGEKGKKINEDIANLVKKGLPPMIQKSLDIIRVIGNEAVHPGQIDLKDDRDTAMKLFELINLIANVMITQPKEVQKIFESLPESKKTAIEERDK